MWITEFCKLVRIFKCQSILEFRKPENFKWFLYVGAHVFEVEVTMEIVFQFM